MEGNELRNIRTKKAVVYAVGQLAESIHRLGLRVEKTEEKLEAPVGAENVLFEGYADLILRDRTGKAFVLDMKWTNFSRYRQEEIQEGRAMQLAAYAWLLRALEAREPNEAVSAGYFMLAQGELLSDSSLLGNEALPSARSLEEIWDMSLNTWDNDMKILHRGTIEARGVKEKLIQAQEGLKPDQLQKNMKEKAEARGLIYVAPSCSFCDFSVLCGLRDVSEGRP
jgi:DNA-binding transcriptional regulator YhcF (GntR family)